MDSYLIFIDASADSDHELINKAGVKCVPMEYSLGDTMLESYGQDTPEQLKAFYDSQRSGQLTQTTQIAPFNYISLFSEYMQSGQSILYISLSSGLSSTYESACSAKEYLEEKYPGSRLVVVDSLGATAGIGIITEKAIANRAKGMSIDDNAADLNIFKTKIRYYFMVPDLLYLKRGGRVSAASAVIGTALSIIPLIKIDENGKLVVFEKKRGEKLAIKELANLAKNEYKHGNGFSAFVINADAEATKNAIHEKLNEVLPGIEFKDCGLAPVIGAHTGPGMAAVCFVGK